MQHVYTKVRDLKQWIKLAGIKDFSFVKAKTKTVSNYLCLELVNNEMVEIFLFYLHVPTEEFTVHVVGENFHNIYVIPKDKRVKLTRCLMAGFSCYIDYDEDTDRYELRQFDDLLYHCNN